ncbi:MAG: dihydrolipoyl dehydrogenase [Desulfobulbaceae bacterium]|nr:dihydrolipoyl dehydrogenase [Desulfobulbaceae bacterium]
MYDVAVLGSGPGGYVAALRAALRGAKVCIIEKNKIGGTCLNVGCIPTKAMLHSSELFWEISHAKDLGITVEAPKVDAATFTKRTAKVVSGLSNGVSFLLKKRKVDIIEGRGTLTAPDTISIEGKKGTQEIKAKSIILATGSRPAKPGFLPWDCKDLMTTNQATTAKDLPESVLILGGGVIGCEFATVYAELGIPTTLVEMLDSLVANLDDDICSSITKSLKKRKVKVMTGTKLLSIEPAKTGGVVAKLENGKEVKAAKVLVAIGRTPNLEDIGLETLGIELQDGIVKVNDKCQTNIPNVYAIGDMAEKMQYAHLASRMGIIAADNATGHDESDDRTIVPSGIYTHPEVATVGISEQEAKESHPDAKIVKFPYAASGMAQAYGQTDGMVKIIAEPKYGSILGGVVIGPHATDIIQEFTLAMKNELTVEELAHTIHPHPTFAEAVGEAAEIWTGMPIHTL